MTALDGTLGRHDWNRTAGVDFAAALGKVPLFARLGRRQLRKIARYAEVAAFVPGDAVLRSADSAEFFYVVLRGEAEAREQGRTRRLRRGDYFGETALLDGTSHPATVIATDELYVLRLPGPVFLRLAQQSPTIAFAILTQLGREVQLGDQRLISRAA
jgi:CRP-like cAMP-binding protein